MAGGVDGFWRGPLFSASEKGVSLVASYKRPILPLATSSPIPFFFRRSHASEIAKDLFSLPRISLKRRLEEERGASRGDEPPGYISS